MKKEYKVRNTKLYDYITEFYIKADKPVTQQEIANEFGMSIGAIKNFMYRHDLNKKGYYNNLHDQIIIYKNKGLKTKEITKLLDVSQQYIHYQLKKKKYAEVNSFELTDKQYENLIDEEIKKWIIKK